MLKLVVYAANTSVLPDNDLSIPADYLWSRTDAPSSATDLGNTKATLTPQGTLHISDTEAGSSGHRHIFARYDTLDSTDGAIFEIKCHLISSGASYGVAFGFIDTDKFLEVFLR